MLLWSCSPSRPYNGGSAMASCSFPHR
jgi:hypothetical protein